MKFATTGQSIGLISSGLISLAALMSVANAADMPGHRGSAKDYGQAAVPVPAPVPYEEHYKWYMGAGVGYTVRGDSNITSSVTNLCCGGISTINAEDGPVYGSVFAGRYLTPSLRVELSADFRAKQKIVTGEHSYRTRYTSAPTVVGTDANYAVYDVVHDEKSHLTTNTYMLNAFYEFGQGRKIRPYVGAGIGFATHYLRRELTETSAAFECGTVTGGVDTSTGMCDGALPAGGLAVGAASTTGFGLAAALMAGATVDLGPRTHLDIGYRLMYMGSKTAVALPDSLAGMTTIDVGARTDHELRTAIRVDLW